MFSAQILSSPTVWLSGSSGTVGYHNHYRATSGRAYPLSSASRCRLEPVLARKKH